MHKTKDAEIDKPRVAFICVHNSCRSQIAEALGKHLASDVFESYSAGTETKNRINPDAVRIIKQLYGIDMEETQRPKLLEDIPPVDIVIYPVLVQGDRAPASIIKGLETLDKREDVDLIITGRGGGSMEELFAFNDEKLARCIFNLKTPIISAVGHETDFTIADFVADIRASTPSAAAELSVPDKDSLMDELRGIAWALDKHTSGTILEQRNIIDGYKVTLNYINPVQKLMDKKIELDNILKSIEYMLEKQFINKEKSLFNLKNRLQLVDPETILKLGYGVVSDHNGNMRKNISEIIPDERLYINMIDGRVDVVVLNKEEA